MMFTVAHKSLATGADHRVLQLGAQATEDAAAGPCHDYVILDANPADTGQVTAVHGH